MLAQFDQQGGRGLFGWGGGSQSDWRKTTASLYRTGKMVITHITQVQINIYLMGWEFQQTSCHRRWAQGNYL